MDEVFGTHTVGDAAVIITVLFIVPLRPQRVLTTGVLQWLRALRTLPDAVLDRLDGKREPLRPLIRQVDAAYAALVTTATPLRGLAFGRTQITQITQILAVSSAACQHARSLAASLEDAEAAGAQLPGADDPPLRAAAEQLRTSLQASEHRLATGEHGTYVRSASLLALALDDLRQRPSPLADVLHDLTRLDATLARLARALQMDVTDHDNGQPPTDVLGSADQSHTGPSPT